MIKAIVVSLAALSALLTALCALACTPDVVDPDAEALVEGPVFLNEAQSRNDRTLLDARGSFSDWLELFNASDEDIALDGYALEDNGVGKREFPAGSVIAARGYLLVIADDATDGGTATEPHFPFKLDGDEGGDEIALFDPDGVVISRLALPPVDLNASYGRTVDGGDELDVLANPTPRATNTCIRPFEVPPAIVLNEALVFAGITGLADEAGEVEPWFELLNTGSEDVNLRGLVVTETLTTLRWVAPAIVLAAGEYLVVFTDGEPAEGELHAPFRPEVAGSLDVGEVCGSTYGRLSLVGASVGTSVALAVDGDPFTRTTDATPTPGSRNE